MAIFLNLRFIGPCSLFIEARKWNHEHNVWHIGCIQQLSLQWVCLITPWSETPPYLWMGTIVKRTTILHIPPSTIPSFLPLLSSFPEDNCRKLLSALPLCTSRPNSSSFYNVLPMLSPHQISNKYNINYLFLLFKGFRVGQFWIHSEIKGSHGALQGPHCQHPYTAFPSSTSYFRVVLLPKSTNILTYH